MVSVPCDVPYQLPIGYKPQLGKGLVLIEGGDIAIVAYGPTMLCEAVMASQVLKEQHNVQAMIINLPWLNVIDNEWLLEKVSDCKILYSIDNHFIVGGQGDSIANVIASSVTSKLTLVRVGLDEIPVSGTNKEVLNKHKLDAEGIVKRVLATFY
jgi:transketolase